MHFKVILLTDRQTDKRRQTHLPPPLSEVTSEYFTWMHGLCNRWFLHE